MEKIHIALPSGAGIVETEDGYIGVTGDVSDGPWSLLQPDAPYSPQRCDFGVQQSVVGGRLPPGAVSADVIDLSGETISAETKGDLYIVVLDEPRDYPDEIVVCCRDASRIPVRRPFPLEHTATRVTDATVPCPACGEIDYEECEEPLTDDRFGGGMVNRERVPSRSVCCRVCGQTWYEGVFFTYKDSSDDTEEQRAARIARARARRSDHLRSTLEGLNFPIYVLRGRPAWYVGSGTNGESLSKLTVGHYQDETTATDRTVRPSVTVATERPDPNWGDHSHRLREALRFWIQQAEADQSTDDDVSHAEWTLRHSAFDRACRAEALTAEQSAHTVVIDGVPEPFQTLTTATGLSVATGLCNGLRVAVSARHLHPSDLVLETLRNPSTDLIA